jgi:hypothetical protein
MSENDDTSIRVSKQTAEILNKLSRLSGKTIKAILEQYSTSLNAGLNSEDCINCASCDIVIFRFGKNGLNIASCLVPTFFGQQFIDNLYGEEIEDLIIKNHLTKKKGSK